MFQEFVELRQNQSLTKIRTASTLTKQGVRFTISEATRVEVLDRLLELNHQRYAQEVAAGLHDKCKAKKKSAGKDAVKKVSGKGRARQPSAPFSPHQPTAPAMLSRRRC